VIVPGWSVEITELSVLAGACVLLFIARARRLVVFRWLEVDVPLFVAGAALLGIREAAVYRGTGAYWLALPVFLAAVGYLWWFNRLRSRSGNGRHRQPPVA
jgi:hypothetical protein